MKFLLLALLLLTIPQQSYDNYKKVIIDGRKALVSKNDTIYIYNDNEVWAEDTFVEKQTVVIKRLSLR